MGVHKCVWCVSECVGAHVCLAYDVHVDTHPHAYLNHKTIRLDPVLEDTRQKIAVYSVPSDRMRLQGAQESRVGSG